MWKQRWFCIIQPGDKDQSSYFNKTHQICYSNKITDWWFSIIPFIISETISQTSEVYSKDRGVPMYTWGTCWWTGTKRKSYVTGNVRLIRHSRGASRLFPGKVQICGSLGICSRVQNKGNNPGVCVCLQAAAAHQWVGTCLPVFLNLPVWTVSLPDRTSSSAVVVGWKKPRDGSCSPLQPNSSELLRKDKQRIWEVPLAAEGLV